VQTRIGDSCAMNHGWGIEKLINDKIVEWLPNSIWSLRQ
jgi:hypothetical protein